MEANERTSRASWQNQAQRFVPYMGLVLIVVLFGALTRGRLLSFNNLRLLFSQALVLMIGCTGVTFVMAQGSLDFSQGSLVGFAAAVAAIVAVAASGNTAAVVAVTVATGIGVGFANGWFLSYLKIPSFIVTLCMLFVLRGLTVVLTKSGSIPIPFSMDDLDSYSIKIPVLAVILALFVYFYNYTRIGKYSRAIGSGETAAAYSGVPVRRFKTAAFVVSGLLGGVCGFLSLIRTGTADSKTGLFFEIDILTALVVGGMPVTGGTNARIHSAIIGALILTILTNGLVLVGMQAELQEAVKGAVFLIAVLLSFERQNVAYIK